MPSVLGEFGRVEDGHAAHIDVFAAHGIDRPGGRVGERDAFDEHVAAVGKADQARARDRQAVLAVGAPPEAALPVDHAAPGDGDVFQAVARHEGSIGLLLHALPTVGGDGVIGGVLAAKQGCAGFQVQGDVVAKEERSGQVAPGGNGHRAASAFGAGVDGGLQRRWCPG